MNNIWSDNIQGIKTLYLSRKLRFDDFFYERYKWKFSLDEGKKLRILEIGCGPGALAGALHRWYPNAEIVAIDRDSNFIEYAKENISGVKFVEGDATALPFEADNPQYSSQMAEDMINAEREAELEAVQSLKLAGANRIIDVINEKYDSRIELYRKGDKQWDTNTSITMIIRGINKK